jgi:hypothetical protein
MIQSSFKMADDGSASTQMAFCRPHQNDDAKDSLQDAHPNHLADQLRLGLDYRSVSIRNVFLKFCTQDLNITLQI